MQQRSKPSMPEPLKSSQPRAEYGGTSVPTGAREQYDRRILRRWEKWAPLVRTQSSAVSAHVQIFRQKHRSAMLALLSAGLQVRRIEALNLDDPRLSQSDRDALLKEVINEQNRRQGSQH